MRAPGASCAAVFDAGVVGEGLLEDGVGFDAVDKGEVEVCQSGGEGQGVAVVLAFREGYGEDFFELERCQFNCTVGNLKGVEE